MDSEPRLYGGVSLFLAGASLGGAAGVFSATLAHSGALRAVTLLTSAYSFVSGIIVSWARLVSFPRSASFGSAGPSGRDLPNARKWSDCAAFCTQQITHTPRMDRKSLICSELTQAQFWHDECTIPCGIVRSGCALTLRLGLPQEPIRRTKSGSCGRKLS